MNAEFDPLEAIKEVTFDPNTIAFVEKARSSFRFQRKFKDWTVTRYLSYSTLRSLGELHKTPSLSPGK